MFKLACIIATKDRAFELNRLLMSIQDQEILPQQIIIVDASQESAAVGNQNQFPSLKIKRVKAEQACLPAQRNQGLKLLESEMNFVCFLDDDIVFHPGAMKAMATFWEQASNDTGGAVFNIMNEKKPSALVFFKRIFGTGSFKRGIVLPSGYNTLMCPASETVDVQWLFGGATVWRREVFNQFLFDGWFEGTGLCEDLDFSYRVAKKYKLFVVAGAQVDHLTGTVSRRRNVWFGASQIKNRFYFVRKHKELSQGLCCWASIGQMLENIALGIFSFSSYYFMRAWGNLIGFFELGKIST